MISRKTALTIADAYVKKFSGGGGQYSSAKVYATNLYDFLYGNDFQSWFCNAIRTLNYPRNLKDWILRLHTGESQVNATKNWTWEQRQALGQRYLHDIAEAFLHWYYTEAEDYYKRSYEKIVTSMKRALELDGYVYRDGTLLFPEEDVLDVEEEVGVLNRLHKDLNLGNREVAFEALRLSEDHYRAGRWSDCIANSRKFLESVLQEIASNHSRLSSGEDLAGRTYSRPVAVRDYLEREDLLEKREREAIDKIYGLLSHTGSHPYMAESDQARLLRQLSLTTAQFAMLRFEGFSNSKTKA
ncbi:MAG: hypothetical protein H7A51_11940 [Akkermansiaceae bacterium]|nr:hypothetical protein [Akkermansiaceae bacterium]